MAYVETDTDFFLEFINSLQELCELLPEDSDERKQLEELLESWEQFKREKEYAQEDI